ncbi:SDR family NAD(P)-dependent oxidoreductase [Bacillus aerolatus]|uniref:SDR family NAD(P)-dependent oxidoreductase n=1 Tax=Bacillus aerolatus TaxID=2653354 RepID=A0A6I1FUA7_9BACI|nr:SDR family NAD(P)-dependent oxidoreductase [Bacillus aerolatus]KAB7706153.1 SDR family NAD(P)-dependent oxidoreductase [Bacillus aerolatus]
MNIFITGATGFLGTNLVKKLIEEGHHIYVLMRNQIKFNKLLDQLDSRHINHVHAVEGELTTENLGLKAPVLQRLIGNIDVFCHSAAMLSFDENDREKSFCVNVQGTKHVLDLAELVGAKTFIHVSTAYTLGSRKVGTETLYPLQSSFTNSYEESKCHAEHLVMTYKDKFDVMVMRPSIIIGDSMTGKADTTFGLYSILRTIELLKKKLERNVSSVRPSYRLLMDKDTVSNLVPVNYVVKVITRAMNYGNKNKIYNIVNTAPLTNSMLVEAVKEAFDFDQIEMIPYEDRGLLTLEEQKMNEPLDVFKDYLNRSINFQDENTRELLSYTNEEPFHMEYDTVLRIINGFRNRRAKVKIQ